MSEKPQIPFRWPNGERSTEAERWAWEEISEGRIADFNKRYENYLDPKNSDGWDNSKNDRRLSAAFLVTILTDDAFRSATPHQGVRIIGARFEEEINLSSARLECQLWLDKCRFKRDLRFVALQIDDWLSLEGSRLGGAFALGGAVLKRSLNLENVWIEGDANLNGTKIGGMLSMLGSIFNHRLTMVNLEVGKNLYIGEGATFAEVNLVSARIGGQFSIGESIFEGKLSLNSATVGQGLFMGAEATFRDVDLAAARIGGKLNIRNCTFKGWLEMSGLQVDEGLIIVHNSKFDEVNLSAARIGGQFLVVRGTFNGKFTMNGAEIGQGMFLQDEVTFQEADLTGARIKGTLSIAGSSFNGKLTMNGAEIERGLFMNAEASFNEVDLTAAKIGDVVSMQSSSFNGQLTMSGTEIRRSLSMDQNATFQGVDLGGAKIGGQLVMAGSTFEKTLNMNSMEVRHQLFMDDGATFKDVDLTGASIGSQLSMNDSTFKGVVNMESMEVGQSLLARSARFFESEKVRLMFAKIGSNLDLSDATIAKIDLTGATIEGELRLGSASAHEPPNWVGDSFLILRNTTVGAMQDAGLENDSWPSKLDLAGFDCRTLVGFGGLNDPDFARRPSWWLLEWLKRDISDSPQPFERLANLLRETGYPSKANDILYASRERARGEILKEIKDEKINKRKVGIFEKTKRILSKRSRWFGMSLLKWAIGYGLGMRYFWALRWMAGLTLLGFGLLWLCIPEIDRDFFTLLGASFERLLPFAEFNDSSKTFFEHVSLPPLVWGYFFFHKLVGYVLASFLIAGLAGLTQKS